MKIVFVSNYYNHHQSSLSMSLYKELLGDFFFISTSQIPDERIALGYCILTAPFVLNYDKEKEKCMFLINSADVVIFGSAPYELIRNRLKKGKLVFIYSERIYKTGDIKSIELLLRRVKNYLRMDRFQNSYLLCASAFASYDYSMTHSFINKAFKWGYFPEAREYKIEKLLDSKDCSKILWVGRLIDWKHPEYVIHAAKMLKDNGYIFSVDIIGAGIEDQSLKLLINDCDLTGYVNLVGSVSSNMVRKYMERAGIFLFTSDRNEGWGAVLNESMNSACAVVASDSIGSVPFLLSNNKNGLIYHSGDINQLYNLIKSLLDNHSLQSKLGLSAYNTIINKWNADVAAKRLVVLSSYLLGKTPNSIPFDEGPCNRAPIIKDDWFITMESL